MLAERRRRGPGLGVLLLFLLMAGAVGFGFFFYVNWQRIETVGKKETATPAPARAEPAASAPAPKIAAAGGAATSAAAKPIATPAPAVTDRDFVAAPAFTPAAPTATTNQVEVIPLRKTWITVRKEDPNSPPIFEDYLYPDLPPLRLKGSRFFIEARDPSSIQIRKNGGAQTGFQSPGVAVQ
jgi:hypothetical protein